MTIKERTYLQGLLKKSEIELLAVLEGVSEEEFLQKPFEDEWSMAEIVEHLVRTDTGLLRQIQKQGEKAVSSDSQRIPNERLVNVILDRKIKVKAPSFLVPQGVYTTKKEAITAFRGIRTTVNEFVETTDWALENITFKHFVLGVLDGKGWLAFMAGHCQRHTEQMRALKIK